MGVEMQYILARSIAVMATLMFTAAQSQSTFNAHDLSGVWQFAPGGGGQGPGDNFPPLTPWGLAKYDANKPGYAPKAPPGGNDPILKCDPMGFPRILFVIWPFEIIHTPGRILMFFEGQHTIREIWMDGRKVPDDPDPRWYGYSVGHWDGDTLVVDTVGLDPRGWLDEWDTPFSEETKVEERWHRVDRDTLELTFTLTDPKYYSKPWTSDTRTFRLQGKNSPDHELLEVIFAPLDEQEFNRRVRNPAAGVK